VVLCFRRCILPLLLLQVLVGCRRTLCFNVPIRGTAPALALKRRGNRMRPSSLAENQFLVGLSGQCRCRGAKLRPRSHMHGFVSAAGAGKKVISEASFEEEDDIF
jgi:hypothetical protein